MRRARTRIGGIAVALALLLAKGALAENTILILAFGGEPGAPLPHAYNYGKAEVDTETYKMRIPVVDRDVQTVLADTELTVRTADNVVLAIHAARAYRTMKDCEAARSVISDKLAEALPRTAAVAGWARAAVDGTVVARSFCDSRRYYPMPVLRLELATPD